MDTDPEVLGATLAGELAVALLVLGAAAAAAWVTYCGDCDEAPPPQTSASNLAAREIADAGIHEAEREGAGHDH